MEFEAPSTVFAYSTPSKPHSRLSVMFPPLWLPRVISIASVPLRQARPLCYNLILIIKLLESQFALFIPAGVFPVGSD